VYLAYSEGRVEVEPPYRAGNEVSGDKGGPLAQISDAELNKGSHLDWISGRRSSCLACQLSVLETSSSPDRVVLVAESTRREST
jgi:hypothetical protein